METTDQPASAPAAASATSQEKSGFIGKWAGWCSRHGGLSFAIIVILVVLVIVMFIYYNGYFGLGQGRGSRFLKGASGSGRKKKESARNTAQAGGDDEGRGDPETERLIDSINGT